MSARYTVLQLGFAYGSGSREVFSHPSVMAYGKGGFRASRKFGKRPRSGLGRRGGTSQNYIKKQHNKTSNRYRSMPLYKHVDSGNIQYFQSIMHKIQPTTVSHVSQRDQGRVLKVVAFPSQLVACDLFQRQKTRYGSFKLLHFNVNFIVSRGEDAQEAANNVPVCFTSCFIVDPDHQGQTTLGQIVGGADPSIGPYNDVNLIYNNEYTKTHVLKPGETAVQRMFKCQIRRDQQGSISLPTDADWGNPTVDGSPSNLLARQINDKTKAAVLFHMPADCQCTVVTTYKVLLSGQPGF